MARTPRRSRRGRRRAGRGAQQLQHQIHGDERRRRQGCRRQAIVPEKKNDVTTDQVKRNVGPDGSDLRAAAVVVSIDDIKTTASVAANASISTKGGAVSVSAQSLNQIDPNKLWLVNLYAPFDGIEAKWKAADGTSAKMGVATGAAKAFPEQSPGHAEQHGRHLVQLQQLGQRDRQEQEAGAVGGFSIDVHRPRPARPWRASSTRAAARAARPAMSTSRR